MRGLVLGLVLATCNVSAAPAVEPLGDDAYLLQGMFTPGQQPDGNSVLLLGDAGMVAIDSGRHPEHTQRILDFAHARHVPITDVINTHWHLDHVGGNPMLRNAYPELKVHASTAIVAAMDGFLANYRKDLQAMIATDKDASRLAAMRTEMALIDSGKALFPDVPVTAAANVTMAGRELQLHLVERAVTAGDVWLYDPRAHVLISGDLVTLPVPLLDTACPSRWQQSLAELRAVDFRTLVPGHGAPMSPRDLANYRRGFDKLLGCAASDAEAAQCIDGWMSDLGELIPTEDRPFARRLLDYYVTQVLRGDPAVIAQRCGDAGTP